MFFVPASLQEVHLAGILSFNLVCIYFIACALPFPVSMSLVLDSAEHSGSGYSAYHFNHQVIRRLHALVARTGWKLFVPYQWEEEC